MLMNNNKNNKYINVINMVIWWINKAIIYKIKMVIRYILVRFKVKDSNIDMLLFIYFSIIFYYYLLKILIYIFIFK